MNAVPKSVTVVGSGVGTAVIEYVPGSEKEKPNLKPRSFGGSVTIGYGGMIPITASVLVVNEKLPPGGSENTCSAVARSVQGPGRSPAP